MPNMSTANSTPSYIPPKPAGGGGGGSWGGGTSPATTTPTQNIPTSTPTTSTPSGTNPQSPTTTATPVGQDARTSYQSQLAEIMKGAQTLQTNFNSYKANQSGQTDNGKYPTTEKPKDSEYLKFMKGLQDPAGLKTALDSQAQFAKMSADEMARNREQSKEIQENKAGMIERGQKYLKQDLDRASAATLADLALADGYNTDIINQQMALGKTIGEAEEALRQEGATPLSIEEAQILGLPFGTTLAEARQAGIIPSSMSEVSEADYASAQAYADMINSGEMKIENVPADQRGIVAQLTRLGTNTANEQISEYRARALGRMKTTIGTIQGLVSNWSTGFGSWLSFIPTSDARDLNAELTTLKANVGFQELTAMRDASKTGGALGNVSDTEIKLLTNTLAALDTGQSPERFKENLQEILDGLAPFLEELELLGMGQTSGSSGAGGGGEFDGENWD